MNTATPTSGRIGSLGAIAFAAGLFATAGFAGPASAHTPEPQTQQSAAVKTVTQDQTSEPRRYTLRELREKGFGRQGGTK